MKKKFKNKKRIGIFISLNIYFFQQKKNLQLNTDRLNTILQQQHSKMETKKSLTVSISPSSGNPKEPHFIDDNKIKKLRENKRLVEEYKKGRAVIYILKKSTIEKLLARVSGFAKNIDTISVESLRDPITAQEATNMGIILTNVVNLKTLNLFIRAYMVGTKAADNFSKGFEALQKLSNLCFKLRCEASEAQNLTNGLPHLINLKQLIIDFESNAIGDYGIKDLGSKIQALKNVTCLKLYMRNNGIGNDGCIQFGGALKEMKAIDTLKLEFSKNVCGDYGVDKVMNGVKELKNLKKIHLNFFNNGLEHNSGKYIGDALLSKPQLKRVTLLLRSNLVGPIGAKLLAERISKIITIEKLKIDLGCNAILKHGIKNLVILSNLSSLRHLVFHLECNATKAKSGKHFRRLLEPLKNLSFLKLSLESNELRDEGIKSLSECFTKSRLKHLDIILYNNSISSKGGKYLLRNVSQIKCLENFHLRLKWNSVNDKRILRLHESFTSLTTLKILSLEIFIGNQWLNSFADTLSLLKNLENLSLCLKCDLKNPKLIEKLSKSLKIPKMKALSLNLYEDNISTEGAQILSKTLIELKELEAVLLDISCNEINDSGAISLLDSLETAKNLKETKLIMRNTGAGSLFFKAVKSFFESRKKSLKLMYLDITNDPLSTEDIKMIEILKDKYSNNFHCYY